MATTDRQATYPVLLDTNIVLYLYRGFDPGLAERVAAEYIVTNQVIIVESLGWSSISPAEDRYLRDFYQQTDILELTAAVFERAILIRKHKKIALPDALIAATAIEYGAILWTANSDDFAGIPNLKLLNPFK